MGFVKTKMKVFFAIILLLRLPRLSSGSRTEIKWCGGDHFSKTMHPEDCWRLVILLSFWYDFVGLKNMQFLELKLLMWAPSLVVHASLLRVRMWKARPLLFLTSYGLLAGSQRRNEKIYIMDHYVRYKILGGRWKKFIKFMINDGSCARKQPEKYTLEGLNMKKQKKFEGPNE